MIPIHLVIEYPIYLDLIFLLGSALSTIIINLASILVDSYRPKLVWEQETAAVKQNMNGFISMLFSFLFAAVCIALLYMLWVTVVICAVVLLIAQIILVIVLYRSIKNASNRLLNSI